MARQVGSKNVVGREKLIEKIWKKLETRSLQFTAERRVGKTTVMTKMAAEPKAGYEVLFMDLEGIDSPTRFVELVINRARPLLSATSKIKKWWDDLRNATGGTEIGGVFKLPDVSKVSWQDLLTKTLERLCEYQPDRKILLIFDELPYMLQKIASLSESQESRTQALTLLDTLRLIRQKYPNLRMIYAGSVGLHHVVKDLKQDTLASQPVNDMPMVDIRALDHSDAIHLASNLLSDERVDISQENQQAVLETLVHLTDAVPFYIHAVCSKLGEYDGPIDVQRVEQTVRQQLSSDQDPWEMEHFRKRLAIYYKGTIDDVSGRPLRNEDIARTILDHIAAVPEPLSIDQVWSVVKSRFQITDRNHIVEMLAALALDHYLDHDLDSNDKKRYLFRFPLIQKWWKLAQGL